MQKWKILPTKVKNWKKSGIEITPDGEKTTSNNSIYNNINNIKEKVKRKGVVDDHLYEDILAGIKEGAFKETLGYFIEMRKSIKKPLTKRALELILEKLKRLSSDEITQIAILEQSILNNWQDVYALKEKNIDNQEDRNNFNIIWNAYPDINTTLYKEEFSTYKEASYKAYLVLLKEKKLTNNQIYYAIKRYTYSSVGEKTMNPLIFFRYKIFDYVVTEEEMLRERRDEWGDEQS